MGTSDRESWRVARSREWAEKRERLLVRAARAKSATTRHNLLAEARQCELMAAKALYGGPHWELAFEDDPISALEAKLEDEARKVWQCSFCQERFYEPTEHYAIMRVICPGSPGYRSGF